MLRGIVRDGAGRPLGGAVVVARREEATVVSMFGAAPPEARAGQSDAGGAYVLRDLGSGVHSVDVVAIGLPPPRTQRVTLVAGQAAALDLVVPAGGTLRGLVHDAAGPIAGAEVRAHARPTGLADDGFGAMASLRGGYTQDDGTFAIEGLVSDQWYDVEVAAPWHSPGRGGGRPSESVVDVALVATGAIVGEVEGDATDASIACRPATGGDRAGGEEMSGGYAPLADGAFRIDGIRPGVFTCEIHGPLAEATLERVEVKARETTRISAKLKDKPLFEVTVVATGTGAPIADAYVQLGSSDGQTDAQGLARLSLPAAPPAESAESDDLEPERRSEWTLRVSATGHDDVSIELSPPLPKSRTVKLTPLPEVKGRVIDEAGLPAMGAMVAWYRSGDGATTDEQGRFAIRRPFAIEPDGEGLSAPELLARRVEGKTVEEGKTVVPDDPRAEIVIALARVEPGEIAVVVRTADGPVAAASVVVIGSDSGARGVTDADGSFRATELLPGEYMILVESDSAGSASRDEVEVLAGKRSDEVVVLGQGWTVEGSVVRAGRPVEGAEVTVSAGRGNFATPVITRADGTFRVGSLPEAEQEARITVTASGGRAHRNLTVRRGGPPVVIDVATTTVRGRVMTGEAPAQDVQVRAKCQGQRGTAGAGDSDAEGRFELDVPGSADCLLLLSRDHDAPTTVELKTLAEGAQLIADIQLVSRTIHGHVSLPESARIDGVSFVLLAADSTPIDFLDAPVAGDASFDLAVGGPASFLAFATEQDEPSDAVGWVTGTLDPDAPLEIVFPPAGAVEVLATSQSGTPVEGYASVVTWNGRPISRGAGAALEGGRGTVRGLAAGHLVLRVTTDEGSAQVEADVAPNETKRVSVTIPAGR
jgi:hypothetical protein